MANNTTYNPWTGKQDFIGVTESELNGKEDLSNKTTSASSLTNSSTKYVAERAMQEHVAAKIQPSIARNEFYGTRGVTLNSVHGYAIAKWIDYGDGWSDSLDRIDFGMRKSAELGMKTVTEVAAPGNFYTDYNSTYIAVGDFTGRNFAADDWSALDLTMQLARKYRMKLVLRIPNQSVLPGDSVTKYSSTDYLNKYLKPLWGYIFTRYASYSDVIECADWGFEISGRYTYNSTFFSNSLTNRVGYMLGDEWVYTHVALRDYLRGITTAIPVALPSTNDWIADGVGQSAGMMLHQMNEIDVTYTDKFDNYVLLDYYGNWNNNNGFKINNNNPFDSTSYFGDTAWLTDASWDEVTTEATDALALYNRTDVKLGAPEGGIYLVLQGSFNMTTGSGAVTESLSSYSFLNTPYLAVGEKVLIGNDGVEYTITALGGGTPAGSQMTVAPVSSDNKNNVRIIRKDHEADQYYAMRWVYKKANAPGSNWGFFNWFMFWDNSTNFPLGYTHYVSPGISGYAQQGAGFVESDTLKETVTAALSPPENPDMLYFPKYMSNDAAHGQLTIVSDVTSTSGNPSVALAVKKTFDGGTGGLASFENDSATASYGAPFLFRRSKSGGAVDDNTNGGTLRYQFHDGTNFLNRAEIAAMQLDTATGATILKLGTSLLGVPTTGGVSPAVVIDENQNVYLRNNASTLGEASGAVANLVLTSVVSAAPSTGIANAVSLRGADISGAGTTGLKILTENNKEWSFGEGITFPDATVQTTAGGQFNIGMTRSFDISTDDLYIAPTDSFVKITGTHVTHVIALGYGSPAPAYINKQAVVLSNQSAQSLTIDTATGHTLDGSEDNVTIGIGEIREITLADGSTTDWYTSGRSGAGTVTSVTSANADIAVATTTTTPVLTLNSGIAANQLVKRDASGYIGIGVAAPTTALHIIGSGNGAQIRAENTVAYGSSSGGTLGLIANTGTSAVDAADYRLGIINFAGAYNTSGSLAFPVAIEALSNGAFSSTTAMPAGLRFLTADATGARAERLRITSAGYQAVPMGGAVASASTIAPTGVVFHVTGTTTINTITAPTLPTASACQITIIPDGIFLTGIIGNIAIATTTVIGKALIMTYDTATALWYPSY